VWSSSQTPIPLQSSHQRATHQRRSPRPRIRSRHEHQSTARQRSGRLLRAGDRRWPALFIEGDAPALNVYSGDIITCTIASATSIAGGLVMGVGVSDIILEAIGYDTAPFNQELSNVASVVTDLDLYESEVVSVTGTISGATAGSGTGFVANTFETAAITADAGLRLRYPDVAGPLLGLVPSCTFTATGAAMWRFNAAAQISPQDQAQLVVHTCPAPLVNDIVVVDPNTVVVFFNRGLDPASVIADGSQFSLVNGANVLVTGAAVDGNVLTLTTEPLQDGQTYTIDTTQGVTVPTDYLGGAVPAQLGDVSLPAPLPGLRFNEIDYDNVGTDNAEFVELYNATGANIDLAVTPYTLYAVNGGNGATLGSVLLNAGTWVAGGYLVVASANVVVPPSALSFTFAGNQDQLQNGAPDAVVLVELASNAIIDAVTYEGADVVWDDAGTLRPLNLFQEPSVADNNATVGSLCRLPDATGPQAFCTTLTPGTANQ
jgi:hypothetical protein